MKRLGVAILVILLAAVAGMVAFVLSRPRPRGKPLQVAVEGKQGAPKGPLRIFIPCGLARPFNELRDVWERKYPQIPLHYVYDSAVALVRKAERGEKGDVFISPGEVEIGKLEKDGITDPKARIVFGYVPLVLAVPKDNPARINSLKDLATPKLRTFGLPNPELNSLGYHAREALRRLGLWEKVKPKVVETEFNIRTYMFLAAKKVDAAVLFTACPLRANPEKLAPEKVKLIAKLPYKPLPFIAAPFTRGNRELAEKYISLLVGEEGRRIFKRYGIILPKRAPKEKPVLVEVFYPIDEEPHHVKMVKAVKEVASKFEDKVKVKFFNLRTDEGIEEFAKRGLECGTILVNGKSEFEIGGRRVVLKGPFGEVWTKEDLEEVVKNAVEGRL